MWLKTTVATAAAAVVRAAGSKNSCAKTTVAMGIPDGQNHGSSAWHSWFGCKSKAATTAAARSEQHSRQQQQQQWRGINSTGSAVLPFTVLPLFYEWLFAGPT